MRIAASGNIGIGVNNPSDLLSLLASNSSNTTGITLTNNNGTDQIGNSITFKGSFGAPFSADNLLARISSLVTSYAGSKYGNLTFSTGSGGSISEVMRINAIGQIFNTATGLGAFSSNQSYSLGTGSIAWSSIPNGLSILTGSCASAGTFQNIITGIGNGYDCMFAFGKIGVSDLSTGIFACMQFNTYFTAFAGNATGNVQASSNNFQLKAGSSYGSVYSIMVLKIS
jgi:hypothetical protein